MFSKFNFLIQRLTAAVVMFLCAGAAAGDASNKNYLINGSPFNDTVYWKVTLKAGSAGGLFGDTMGPVRTFRYETVVEVDGKETLVIPGGIYSTDMGSAAASYTVQIPLKDLGILKMDSMPHTYYLKAYTRSYEGDSDVDIGYSLLYASDTVTVEYAGIVLTASDGEYEEYVKVEWKDKLSGETYHLCRDTQTIATGLTGFVYRDKTAEPGKKYQYQVITSNGRESNQDEGCRIIKPKLKRLVLKGVDVLKGHTPTTDKENFLVAGSAITVEAEVLDYDERYHTLVSAKLIGTPMGVPATKNHESRELCCPIQKTDHFYNAIILTYPLNIGEGYHGQYEWKVEADFKVKGVLKPENLTSDPTNAPVFFKKDGKDQAGIPNWFTYWKKDGACPRLKIANLSLYYKDAYGEYDPVIDHIFIAPFAALNHYDVYDSVINKIDKKPVCFSGPHIWGIYTVEEVIAHESEHRKLCMEYAVKTNSFKDSINKIDSDFNDINPWKGEFVTCEKNGGCTVNSKTRPFCDLLINDVEANSMYGFSSTNTDTYGLGRIIGKKSLSGESDYVTYGDNEFLARIAANEATKDISAKKENDWAFPGEQSCIPIEVMTNRQGRTIYGWYVRDVSGNKSMRSVAQDLASRTRQSQAGFAMPKSSSVSPAITVNGMTKEVVYDENGSSVSAVSYKFDMMVVGFNDLRLSGVLTDLNSNIVAYANTSVTSGNVVGELRFEGNDIYESGKNGPFKLESVELVSFTGNDFSELATLSEFKDGVVELNRKDLARNDAYLLNVVSETVSTNGIEVVINTEVNAAGMYEIFATLGSTNGMPVATYRKAMDCSVGTNCFKVVFAASDILKSGVDGPYNIDNLALFKDGVRIDSRLDYSMLKKNYRAGAFDFEEGEEINSDQFMSQFEDFTPPPKLPPVKTYWVVFNANGGTTSETIREVKSGDEIGALPVAESGNDEFLGWYTELEGGTRISNATIITTNVLYHARWQEMPDEVAFTASRVNAQEGEAVVISIAGGNEDFTSSVQLYGVYNTAAAADLDLTKTLLDGKPVKGFKFPYTLSWAAGETGAKTIEIPVKTDKTIEDEETLTLQLANPAGMALGECHTCTVHIKDKNTAISLADSILNHTLKPTTKGDGKWTPAEAAFDDPADTNYAVYAVSPLMKSGKQSSLTLASVKGTGTLYFSLKFIGEDKGTDFSRVSVFDGAKELEWLTTDEYGSDWQDWFVPVTDKGTHNLSFKFIQGENSTVQARLTDVCWIPDVTLYQGLLSLKAEPACGGYVLGGGIFPKTAKMLIDAKPRPGWQFDGWYDIWGELWGKKAKTTVVFSDTTSNGGGALVALFSKIPYVRGLADPADGGKVTGSGLCAEGKKVTLRASANKNFSFVGWYASLADNPNAIDVTKCVATTASLVIDRTAKPTANSKTSTTITGIDGDITYYAVFKGDPRVTVSVDPAPEAGKVTGVGRYAPGKKVTLKATANKGYVFNGWYYSGTAGSAVEENAQAARSTMGEELLTQAASYSFTMPEEDVALCAKFITTEEDAASIALSVDALGGEISPEAIISVTNTCGVALKWSVAADALSQPTVAVSGLPAGLKFTAKDILKKGSKTEVEIPANTIYGAPTAESKLDAKTGLRKPSAVMFTVTTAGKSKRVYLVDMTVLPLPDWAVGTFNGGGNLGQVSLTIAKTGKLSGKYLSEGLTWTLAADSFDSIDESGDVYRATLIGKSGKLVMTNEIGVACDLMGGFVKSIDYIAYQNNWKLEPWKSVGKPFAKAAALEYEDSASVAGVSVPGVLSLKFAASGAVTVKGSFITGINEKTGKEILYSASGTAVLAPSSEPNEIGAFDAVVFVYLPPKTGKFDGYVRCIGVRWTGEGWIKQ